MLLVNLYFIHLTCTVLDIKSVHHIVIMVFSFQLFNVGNTRNIVLFMRSKYISDVICVLVYGVSIFCSHVN
jgi:hypothetical protein